MEAEGRGQIGGRSYGAWRTLLDNVAINMALLAELSPLLSEIRTVNLTRPARAEM